jgi:hypothetical protein
VLGIIVIAVVVLVGTGLLVLLSRVLAAQATRQPGPSRGDDRPRPLEPMGPATPEMLVYLFAHQFVREMPPARAVRQRSRYVAPLTGEEVDPQDAAEKILFVVLSDLYVGGCIDFEVRESDATLMPPFPHKSWTLLTRKLDEFPRGPVADKLAAAFLSHTSRPRKPEDNDAAIPLIDLIETTINGMRAEMSFWKRAGVYGDIRAFVEAHLIERGYMLPPAKETWLDAFRYKPAEPNEPVIARLQRAVDALQTKLQEFRDTHGSRPEADEQDPSPIPEVNQAIVEGGADAEQLPLCDCLRATISEGLTVIRQQEPSEQVGI